MLCLRYVEENNIVNISIETELIGFESLINLEDIVWGSQKGKFQDLVIFSIENLPSNEYTEQFLKNCKLNKVKVHFVAEDKIY